MVRIAVGAHQVDARQELVRRVHAVQVLAVDSREAGKSCVAADEDRFIPFREQFVHGHGAAHYHVLVDGHAELGDLLNLFLHQRLRQAEFGNAVRQHPAERMQRLEDRHFVAKLREIPRAA
ncbi:hypothetical protein D3C74_353670 [compost metagenome]